MVSVYDISGDSVSFRICLRICLVVIDHATDLRFRGKLFYDTNGFRVRKLCVVRHLREERLSADTFWHDSTCDEPRMTHRGSIHLVESDPVSYFLREPLHNSFHMTRKETDNLTAVETVVLLREIVRHIEMDQRHDRFDACADQFVDNSFIMCKALLIRFLLCTGGKDPRPDYGEV